MSRSRFSYKSQDFNKIVAASQLQRPDSEPGVDTVRIYVENHVGRNRECVIWIRFDNLNLNEKGCLPYMREDLLILKLCPLEEKASHHLSSGQHQLSDSEPGADIIKICIKRDSECNETNLTISVDRFHNEN